MVDEGLEGFESSCASSGYDPLVDFDQRIRLSQQRIKKRRGVEQ